jgi:uncharacterized membrane protein
MNPGTILLPLHLLILAFSAWNIARADHLGLAWIRGEKLTLTEQDISRYHTRVWIGLAGMIVTGFLMFWPVREYLLGRQQFLLKMFFVIALVANGFAIGNVQNVATRRKFMELTLREKAPLLVSGAVSTIGWLGAATMAFFILPD